MARGILTLGYRPRCYLERVILGQTKGPSSNQDLYGVCRRGWSKSSDTSFDGASTTAAAYDKDSVMPSTAKGKRDTCEARIDARTQYNLIERITREDHPTKQYFAFANTVPSITTRRFKGMVGLASSSNRQARGTIVLHARFHEQDALLQQMTTGSW